MVGAVCTLIKNKRFSEQNDTTKITHQNTRAKLKTKRTMTPTLPPENIPQIVDDQHRYIDSNMLQIHNDYVDGYVVSIPYQTEEGDERRVVSSVATYGDQPFYSTRPRIENGNGRSIDERNGREFLNPENAIEECINEVINLFEINQV